MLRIDNHNMNFSGQSMKDDISLASFNASYYGNKEINTSVTIVDYKMNEEDKEIFFADLKSFYDAVMDKISAISVQ